LYYYFAVAEEVEEQISDQWCFIKEIEKIEQDRKKKDISIILFFFEEWESITEVVLLINGFGFSKANI
jgi:hypothetical protein